MVQKILDVGCGSHPHADATVVTDLYLQGDKTERSEGDLVVLPGQKFVQADINELPFKDKEFDYVYCTHVLEHVPDPMKACIELMRVAKSGYIETPSLIWETLFGRHFHKWVVKKDKGILVFKKKKIEPNTFDGDLLHREIPVFKKMFNENKDIFSVRFHWENNFKIQCIKYG